MRRLLAAAFLVAAIGMLNAHRAEAQGPAPFGFGFQPFGFYQPYGAVYGTSLRTPPYFSLNPPVYYGTRYSRPYGLSPFASPPLVLPSEGYRGRLRSDFLEPAVPTPGPGCVTNPFIHCSRAVPAPKVAKKGEIRTNPFVGDAVGQLASND